LGASDFSFLKCLVGDFFLLYPRLDAGTHHPDRLQRHHPMCITSTFSHRPSDIIRALDDRSDSDTATFNVDIRPQRQLSKSPNTTY
jgi:hypothetical protein